jgi:hypothetical protein
MVYLRNNGKRIFELKYPVSAKYLPLKVRAKLRCNYGIAKMGSAPKKKLVIVIIFRIGCPHRHCVLPSSHGSAENIPS